MTSFIRMRAESSRRPGALLLLFIISSCASQAVPPAFPGAEGFGALATGGRGGEVYHVANLDDSGPGSFRDAVSRPNRTVVFDIGGVVNITSRLQVAPDITIAGQTAPGDGITVYGERVAFSDNTIVRHMRFHGSIAMPRGGCTVIIDNLKNAIFDHVSIAWGRWDNIHIKGTSDVTLQYCLIAEGIDPQMFGALIERPRNITIHHCLWSNNQSRNPKGKAGLQYYNNVVYNWRVSGFVGGHSAADHYQDMINNYFIAGPNSSDRFIAGFTATDHVYHRGNQADLDKDGKLNGRLVTDEDFIAAKATLLPAATHTAPVPVTLDVAEAALEKVLAGAGASLKRDAVDIRQIEQVKSFGKLGKIILRESDAGGQPVMKSNAALPDSDRDGIPDAWETAHGLDPRNPDDGRQIRSDGYSNLEHYINGLTEASRS